MSLTAVLREIPKAMAFAVAVMWAGAFAAVFGIFLPIAFVVWLLTK